MKVYISGAITGNQHFKNQFKNAEIKLINEGHIPMNPAVLSGGFTHKEYMHICYSMIDVCDAIYLLKGYEDSTGACMELTYATDKKKQIITEK